MAQRFGSIRKCVHSLTDYVHYKIFFNPKNRKSVIKEFHKFFYESNIWAETYWFGTKIYKNPFDVWVYQEIISEIKPDVIIETGTARGGSALFFAHLLDIIGKGRIYTIDIYKNQYQQQHPRIKYLVVPSSTDRNTVERIKNSIRKTEKVMVILDSHHAKNHVLEELRLYSHLVSVGSYLVVEDSNINGHPVNKEYGEGPAEAIKLFLKENKSFVQDRSREKFFVTFNPGGYLKRVR